jgi:hypothetical protein
MACRLYLSFKILIGALMITSVIVFRTNAQTVSSTLELEVTSTKKFGRVLMVKTIISNPEGKKIFLDNFLESIMVEKLDSEKGQFENYLDQWFANTMHDSQRPQICKQIGVTFLSQDGTHENIFAKELLSSNANVLDSIALKQWVDHVVDRIKVLEENGRIEFYTYLHSLPVGAYRLRFRYSNLVGSATLYPVEKFKDAQIPNRLLDYSKWHGEIDSGYIYLTIK